MHTKFKHWGTRELQDTHWRWIVTAEIDSESPKEKRNFLAWMTEHFGAQGSRWSIRTEKFGEQGSRWSIRWSMLGVDIRFHKPKDYFTFTMFHSIEPEKD